MAVERRMQFTKRKRGYPEYVVTGGITIPPGATFQRSVDEHKYIEPHYSVILAIGKDHTAELILSESAIQEHPQLFTMLKKSVDITQ